MTSLRYGKEDLKITQMQIPKEHKSPVRSCELGWENGKWKKQHVLDRLQGAVPTTPRYQKSYHTQDLKMWDGI